MWSGGSLMASLPSSPLGTTLSIPLTEAALIAHCRARLDPDKRPRRFVFVPNLPRNANCKVLCGELRSRLERSD
jgi:acyl-coenzyme A synthetase/AMP-(fatty) acid ligase